MKRGKIKRFNPQTGSGEIKPDNDSRLIGFDKSAIKGDIRQIGVGAKIEYEDDGNPYAPKAKQVVVIIPTPSSAPELIIKPASPKFSSNHKVSHSHSPVSDKSRASASKQRPYNPSGQTHGQRITPYAVEDEFPYDFVMRDPEKSRKHKPETMHEKLLDGHYDIAFEVEWENLTPIAANPCSKGEDNAFAGIQDGYKGFSKRWLRVDGKLAISPFTVKSAIANGFANLLGGCYRTNTAIVEHIPVEKGQYPFGGKWMRYRVAMDGISKPGIITGWTPNEDDSIDVTIRPVKEFYLDEDLPTSLIFDQSVDADIVDRRDHRPAIIANIKANPAGAYRYIGPYCYGMDCKGDPTRKRHKHRFYQPAGNTVTGNIRAENFYDLPRLKKLVYMGQYRDNPNKQWYEDLSILGRDSFIYFEMFDGKVTNIGRNFQFKALFLHDDAVPHDPTEPKNSQRRCSDIDLLCPRCSMFGATDETGTDKDAGGFKGRFKASALICHDTFESFSGKAPVPVQQGKRFVDCDVDVVNLRCGEEQVGGQYLLPIQSVPKPNKRDVNGYFGKQSGMIKGAKVYKHFSCDVDMLVKTENSRRDFEVNRDNTMVAKCAHKLRGFAEVLKKKMVFKGTVGAENCSLDEITALVFLLHGPEFNHGFKIGLGKSLGLGSVTSKIIKVWYRDSAYGWKSVSLDELREELNLNKLLKILTTTHNKIMSLDHNSVLLTVKKYPEPGLDYWRTAFPQRR